MDFASSADKTNAVAGAWLSSTTEVFLSLMSGPLTSTTAVALVRDAAASAGAVFSFSTGTFTLDFFLDGPCVFLGILGIISELSIKSQFYFQAKRNRSGTCDFVKSLTNIFCFQDKYYVPRVERISSPRMEILIIKYSGSITRITCITLIMKVCIDSGGGYLKLEMKKNIGLYTINIFFIQ